MLLNPSRIQYIYNSALNPATLFQVPPDPDLDQTLHDFLDILSHLHKIRADPKDVPLSRAKVRRYRDGGSFIKDGITYARVAVTTSEKVIWIEALPPGTSAQRVKLIALTKTLQLKKEKKT